MLDNYQDLIEELLETPKAVRELLAAGGAPSGPVGHLPPPGGVSPEALALVAELRDRDIAVLDRLQRLTRERSTYLQPLPSIDELAANREAPAADAETLLSGLDTARGDLISLLMNLTLKDWERTGTHEVRGEITVAEEVEAHVDFDEAHLNGIRAAVS
jgi:hypothetical protein